MNQFNLLAVQSSTCQKKPGSYRHAILSYYVLGNFSMFCKASVTKANWLMSNKHHAISPKEKKIIVFLTATQTRETIYRFKRPLRNITARNWQPYMVRDAVRQCNTLPTFRIMFLGGQPSIEHIWASLPTIHHNISTNKYISMNKLSGTSRHSVSLTD